MRLVKIERGGSYSDLYVNPDHVLTVFQSNNDYVKVILVGGIEHAIQGTAEAIVSKLSNG